MRASAGKDRTGPDGSLIDRLEPRQAHPLRVSGARIDSEQSLGWLQVGKSRAANVRLPKALISDDDAEL